MLDQIKALIARDLPDNPPEGFRALDAVGNFDLMLGRVYVRMDGDEMVMGFRVSPRHINAHNTCHGGMLASFADMLAYASRVQGGLRDVSVPTVTLSLEYLIPVVLGQWVEARAEVVKNGRSLMFSRVTGRADGRLAFVASSINVRGPKDEPGLAALNRALGSP